MHLMHGLWKMHVDASSQVHMMHVICAAESL